jgi:uncharacterized damage-inducible protein DinB
MRRMDQIKIYEYLATARERLFEWVRPLPAAEYLREFPIGLRTLGRTLTHIMICEFAYVERIRARPLPSYEQWPIQDENPPPFATLEAAWREQAQTTRQTFAAVRDWHKEFEYRVTPDTSNIARPVIITASPADIATQMLVHEVHHRAQAMAMLRQLGLPAQDLDYNTLMYKRREESPAVS